MNLAFPEARITYGCPFFVILIRRVEVSRRFPAVRAYLYCFALRGFRLTVLRAVLRFLVLDLRTVFLREAIATAPAPMIAVPRAAPPITVAVGFEESLLNASDANVVTLLKPSLRVTISYQVISELYNCFGSVLVHEQYCVSVVFSAYVYVYEQQKYFLQNSMFVFQA